MVIWSAVSWGIRSSPRTPLLTTAGACSWSGSTRAGGSVRRRAAPRRASGACWRSSEAPRPRRRRPWSGPPRRRPSSTAVPLPGNANRSLPMLRITSLKGAVDRLVADGRQTDGGSLRTVARKSDHLRINLQEDVAAKGVSSGFERYRFIHRALPEIDLEEVETRASILGRDLRAPILISCMTGGTPEAERINATLAQVAQEVGLPVGLGSGRVLLENPEVLPTFDMRRHAPDVLLFANLGAVQLNKGVTVDDAQRLGELLGADALGLHLNPPQEALQPHGDTRLGGPRPKD